jgi:hypothetical protein
MEIVHIGEDSWFKIEHHNRLRPFLMNIVSDSNHWMFIASNGGLSAGRKNSRYALFPYYTDDKLIDLAEITGSKTIIKIVHNNQTLLWEPFSNQCKSSFITQKNIYKSIYGNKVMFEEINLDLGITFRYQWNSSNTFGFLRKVELINTSTHSYHIQVLDGIQNIMPYGVEPETQNAVSNLVDAYKRSELLTDSGVGLFTLSAIIVDKTEPSEALKATVVWSSGVENPRYLLSSLQLDQFRFDQTLSPETDVKGEKGAYFVIQDLLLQANQKKEWAIVANVNQNHAQIIEIQHLIRTTTDVLSCIQEDVDRGTKALIQLVASADGLRFSADTIKDARHFSNTLFNIMRGGVFDENYHIEKQDLLRYLQKANKGLFKEWYDQLSNLPEKIDLEALNTFVQEHYDQDLHRLCLEYLPLKFSRRHGDPSRPWNQFSINTRSDLDGSKILDYEGNWRDIFQNWEALVYAYPGFVEGMIFKFLNASTFDGYNPYRLTKDGFDWEVIEPDNPWSFIGYWGDHQIIYLLKLIEVYHAFNPDAFKRMLEKQGFVYANVPYKIKPFDEIIQDPKNTIRFDHTLDQTIRGAMSEIGSDAALLPSKKSRIHHVTFFEKILATVLAKISNFVPEAGIWLNTQRPEWNDANNALVGNGASMVTLYYLRRFLNFFDQHLHLSTTQPISVSAELVEYFQTINSTLARYVAHLDSSITDAITDAMRKTITVELGEAGCKYRSRIYQNGFSGDQVALDPLQIKAFMERCLNVIDHSIGANRRNDHLYHTYNLIAFSDDGIRISRLSEMLEGQVAVLSSNYLETTEVVELLDALRNSTLYRDDQHSYLLYPNKSLPRFLEKNTIKPEKISSLSLLVDMVNNDDQRIVTRDLNGNYHFNGNFRNATDLIKALDLIQVGQYQHQIEQQRDAIVQLFEEVFNHKAFTGRSGTFFAYEGLGSIYWHMVSKLHLAVQEVYQRAHKRAEPKANLYRLRRHYHQIGEGLGIHKTPDTYGAFPTDPYSHTPLHRGAQQPGMTGQVKEDILVNIRELGIIIDDGIVHFKPTLISRNEFERSARTVHCIDLNQSTIRLDLPPHSIAFSFCQVPIVYTLADHNTVNITFHQGKKVPIQGLTLSEEQSRALFLRKATIHHIHVFLDEKALGETMVMDDFDLRSKHQPKITDEKASLLAQGVELAPSVAEMHIK